MRIFLITVLIGFLVLSFRPGEPVATLNCKSESGRTTFTATLPDCSYLEKAELSIDGSKLVFSISDKGNIIFDENSRVFTICLESNTRDKASKFLKFWAVPSSFRKVKSEKGTGTQFHDIYEFRAKLYATEPRSVKEPHTKTIDLICTLDYEL
jgi:hypothetical protein